MLHRLHSVGKILKQYKKERKFLMQRLDQHGDNYREAPAALPYETQEVQLMNLIHGDIENLRYGTCMVQIFLSRCYKSKLLRDCMTKK